MAELGFAVVETAVLSLLVSLGMCLSLAVRIALVYSSWMCGFWHSSRSWWRAWLLSWSMLV